MEQEAGKKEKLLEAAAPTILQEIIRELFKHLAPDPAKLIKAMLPTGIEVPIPSIPGIAREELADKAAKILVTGVPRQQALEAVKAIKKILEEYGL